MALIENRIWLLIIVYLSFHTIMETMALPDELPTTTALSLDNSVPARPSNLLARDITPTSMKLMWMRPDSSSTITGYRVYYSHGNFTYNKTVEEREMYNMEDPATTITGLLPYTLYDIYVKSFNSRNIESEASSPIKQRTDIVGPSAPEVMVLTCENHNTAKFKWHRPMKYYNSIDYYNVSIQAKDINESRYIPYDTNNQQIEFEVTIPNLTLNVIYEFRVRGESKSTVDNRQLMFGSYSEPRMIVMNSTCNNIIAIKNINTEELSTGVILGIICAILAIILAIIAFVLWRKCFHAAYYYLDDPPANPPPTLMNWDSQTDDGEGHVTIPVINFAKHTADLHADGDIGFSKEYDAIQSESTQEEYTSQISQLPENKAKNRYLNIIAYDHTRVRLLPIPTLKKDLGYINANYIDGFQCSRAYIGTQGPLPATFDCFWRMVWEQRVTIIVMITNLVERGRRKCDMYWPKEGTETYGVIQVELLKEDVMATYTIRTFQIKHLRIKNKKNTTEKIVYQYHYTNWPDHGTPDHPLPVLNFVKKSSAASLANSGPIIVHCSAGVGRTGTYIVLDAMLKQIQLKGVVNIFGFLRHIRTQRNFLVQTEEQYIFIHDALVEAIESGETNILQSKMENYIKELKISDQSDEAISTNLLDTQFRLLTSFQAKEFNLVSANKPFNAHKNRSSTILPIESSRVHLTPKPGVDGSDYINATWFQGFQKLREFIITQHPLVDTVLDFWQMIWDHNVQTIVMLSIVDLEEYGIFWPENEAVIEGTNYRVKYISEVTAVGYVIYEFTIQSLQDDYELNVTIIKSSGWPHTCEPITSVFDLLKTVQLQQAKHPNGPTVVVDRFGGTEAATFCILTALSMHLEYEKHADVYMYAKLYHNKRPGIWQVCDDYLFLYDAIAAMRHDLDILPKPLPKTAAIEEKAMEQYQSDNRSSNGFLMNNGVAKCMTDTMELISERDPVESGTCKILDNNTSMD